MRGYFVVIALVLGSLAVAAPAGAVVVGTGTDPVGDAAAPGVDIVGFDVEYGEEFGSFEAEVRLAGPPDPAMPGLLSVSIGPSGAGGCGFPSTSLTSNSVEQTAFWLIVDSPEEGPGPGDDGDAEQTGSGTATQTFRAYSSRLSLRPAECAQAAVIVPDAGSSTYDVTAPIALGAPPAPKLDIKVKDAKRGLKVIVRNSGDESAANVKVRFGKALGMRFVPRARRLKAIRVGARKTSKFKIEIKPDVKRVTKLALSARARGGVAESGTLTVRIKGPLPDRPKRRGGGGGDRTDPLRYSTCLGANFTLIPCLL